MQKLNSHQELFIPLDCPTNLPRENSKDIQPFMWRWKITEEKAI